MFRLALVILLLAAIVLLAAAGGPSWGAEAAIEPEDPRLDRPVEFARDVLPILSANCLACHSASVREGELTLESAQSILRGGASGVGVVPGKPDESPLYLAASRQSDPAMPPLPNKVQAKALSPRELGILKLWIEQGAQGGAGSGQSELHWRAIPESFRAVYSLALSVDQRFLFAGRGNRIFVYDLVARREAARLNDPELQRTSASQGQPAYEPGTAHRDFVHSLAVSPDGNLLASGSYREVKFWKRQPPRLLADFQLPAAPRSIAVDPNGLHAAFIMPDGQTRLWNLAERISGPSLPAEDRARCAAFSGDGKTLLIGAETGGIRCVDPATGSTTSSIMSASPVTAAAWHADGNRFATAHADRVVRAWSLAESSDRPLKELAAQAAEIDSLAFMSSGDELLCAGKGNAIARWNIATGEQPAALDLGGAATFLLSDGDRVIAGSQQGLARGWNAKGERVYEISGGIVAGRALVQETDDAEVARQRQENAEQALKTAEEESRQRTDGLAKAREHLEKTRAAIADAEKKQVEAEQKFAEAQAAASAKPDDKELEKTKAAAEKASMEATQAASKTRDMGVSAERAVQLSEQSARTAKETIERRSAQKQAAEARRREADQALAAARERAAVKHVFQSAAAFLEQGIFVAAGPDQPPQAWSLASGQPADVLPLGEQQPRQVARAGDNILLTCDAAGKACLWNIAPEWELAGRIGPAAETPLDVGSSPFADRVTALAFSPDGALLATGGGEPSRGGELMIWNVAERTLVREFKDAHSDEVLDVEFSRDGDLLLSGAADKFMRLFRVADGTLVRSFEGHTDHVLGVAMKADGSLLASCGADKVIKVWTTQTGEQRRTIETAARQVTSLAFIGVSENLVSSSGDKTVKFHRAVSGQNYRGFTGAQDFLYAALCTRDEAIVAAAGEDGAVRVWNGQDGKLLITFDPPGSAAAASK